MRKRTVTVNDRMQKGYRYALSAAAGRSFDPAFEPQLTPAQMLKLGVFGGKYMTDCRREFPRTGLPAPGFRHAAATARAISSASTPASRSPNGNAKAGSIRTIRAAGSSGTAAITWAGACRTKTGGRSSAGRRSGAMSGRCRNIASPATCCAGAGSARRCCTGPTTAAGFDGILFRGNGRSRRRRFHRPITASITTTARPAASTCQPGLMPASKSNIVPRTSSGDT